MKKRYISVMPGSIRTPDDGRTDVLELLGLKGVMKPLTPQQQGGGYHTPPVAALEIDGEQYALSDVLRAQADASMIVTDASGSVVSVTDGAARAAQGLVSTIAAVQDGETVSLYRTGKNLFGFSDFEPETGSSFNDSCENGVYRREVTKTHTTSYGVGTIGMKYITNTFVKAGTYTFTLTHPATSVTYYKPYLTIELLDGTVVSLNNGETVAIPQDGTITGIRMTSKQFNAGDVIEFTVQLEVGAGTEYEQYNGTTITADLPETVYSGMLDWITGVLTITHDADGAELSEPITHQLDPQTLTMLKGANNIWSDCGDTAVAYVADTKQYIDNALAAIAASVINA